MKKSSRFIKRRLALVLVLLLSIESFAAVVGDNDGAAFITKAEFDSMKNDFQSQLDRYNSSLDNKIDGAIAAYLNGVKIGSVHKLDLDRNCNYVLPLRMFGSESYWNVYNSPYLMVSVPNIQILGYTIVLRSIAPNGARVEPAPRKGNFNIDVSDIPDGGDYLGALVGIVDRGTSLPGTDGYLNEIVRDGNSRTLGTAVHPTWALLNEGIGHYVMTYGPTYNWSYNATTQTGIAPTTRYAEIIFAGLTSGHFDTTNDSTGRLLEWKADQPTPYAWTRTNLRGFIAGWTVRKEKTSETEWDNSDIHLSSMSDLCVLMNNRYGDNSITQNRYNNSRTWVNGEPTAESTQWTSLGARRAVYVGDAMMPANIQGHWHLQPYLVNDASSMPLAKCDPAFGGPTDFWVFRRATDADWPDVLQYSDSPGFQVWPTWRTIANTTFRQETYQDFGQIHAALVSYTDTQGKTHYMDEGMFLGTYDSDGTVQFTLGFSAMNNIQINIAISKKPFGIDASTGDRISYDVQEIGSETRDLINQGSFGSLVANRNYKITVKNIYKGDDLYMMWWPANNGDFVELSAFSDYNITTK